MLEEKAPIGTLYGCRHTVYRIELLHRFPQLSEVFLQMGRLCPIEMWTDSSFYYSSGCPGSVVLLLFSSQQLVYCIHLVAQM